MLGQATGTWTHKTHHGPDSGEATTFPHIVYSVTLQGAHIEMAFLSWDSRDSRGTPAWESRNYASQDSRDFEAA